MIDPVGGYEGLSTVMYADTYDWDADSVIASANPDFTVTADKVASGNLVVTTTYTPSSDASSLAMNASMASVQSFAEVAQSRTLTMLDSQNEMLTAENREGPIMVADASSSMAGLLDGPVEKPLWGLYVEPVYSFGHRAGSATSEGYDSNMVGLEVGLDRKFGDQWLAGAFGGYGVGRIDFNGSNFYGHNNEDQKLYTFGLYGGYRIGDLILTDTLSTTYAEHNMERYAGVNQMARAHYFSWLTHNELLATYNWQPAEYWIISPHVGVNVTYVHQDEFTETEVGNAIHYDDLDKVFADA
ncbi:autotransporter outer membrane beta-barrel domain-containing protein, partial [uncultured Pseudodesulfovibrio sp.]|uniref:autotransporter outer membrane beta-barrel domain-containing protein n=1 Tax=uncultured Pseudodesulfovibrio sp. TaxID=2035858 RepID=UPI0029C9A733